MSNAYRPDRFARAVSLVLGGRVERLGGRKFKVAGNVEDFYYVDLDAEYPCTCMDYEMRAKSINEMCKHRIAGELAGLNPSFVQALADRMEREAKEAEASRPTRRKATKEQVS